MSISDFFKPIWKNSNKEVRLHYVVQISKSNAYTKNNPSVIKVLKNLAIYDKDEKISKIALSLIKDPKVLKEIVLNSHSASHKFTLIQEIEKNTSTRLNEIEEKDVPLFLGLLKDEELVKEIVLLHPKYLELGCEKIINEQLLTEIILKLDIQKLTDQNNQKHLQKLINKINDYFLLKNIEEYLNKKNFNDHSTTENQILQSLTTKIRSLPEYQQEVIIKTNQEKLNTLSQKITNNTNKINEIIGINNSLDDFDDSYILNVTKPSDFEVEWENLKNQKGIEESATKEYQELIKNYSLKFSQWSTLMDQQQSVNQLSNTLKEITANLEHIILEIVSENSKFQNEKYFLIEEITIATNRFKSNIAATKKKWDETLENSSSEMLKNKKIVSEVKRYESIDEQMSKHLETIETILQKKQKVYSSEQQVLTEITNQLNTLETNLNHKNQENNTDFLKKKLNQLEGNWEKTCNNFIVPKELFEKEQKRFNELTVKIKSDIDKIIRQKTIENQQLISNLNQELKEKTKKLNQILINKDNKDKINKKHIKEQYRELVEQFSKTISPHERELNEKALNEFKETSARLKNALDEVMEDLARQQSINLQKKQKLCEVLEELTSLENKEKLAFLLREAEVKWKNIGLVDKQEINNINTRFETVCKTISNDCSEALTIIDEKINTQIINKKDFAKKVENFIGSIKNSELEWKKASQHINEQIKAWKDIKILSYEKNLELNTQFKKLLDSFYQRRTVFYEQLQQERRHILTKKRDMLVELKELEKKDKDNSSLENWANIRNQLLALLKYWYKLGIGFPYSENSKLNDEFNCSYEEIFKNHNEDTESRKNKKTELLNQLIKANTYLENSENLDQNKVTIQNIFKIKHQWDKVAPISSKCGHKLNNDFYQNYYKLLDKNKDVIKEIDLEKQENFIKKKQLLEQLEKTLAESTNSKNTTQTIINIQSEWKKIGLVPIGKDYSKIEKTFFSLTNDFFKQKKYSFKKYQEESKQNYTKKTEILTRLRYLVESQESKNHSLNNSNNQNEKKDFSSDIMNSPKQLKMIWEMNRQFKNNQQNSSKQNTVRSELKSLHQEWKRIGSTTSDRSLNDQFYSLFRKAN